MGYGGINTAERYRATPAHQVDSAAGLAILDCACHALDLAIEAEKVLKKEGLTVDGSRGPRPHPCVSVSRDAGTRLLAALRTLNLDV